MIEGETPLLYKGGERIGMTEESKRKTVEDINSLLLKAGQFKGLRNGIVIQNIESIASCIAMIENTDSIKELTVIQEQSKGVLEALIEKQEKMEKLFEGILDELKKINSTNSNETAPNRGRTTKK